MEQIELQFLAERQYNIYSDWLIDKNREIEAQFYRYIPKNLYVILPPQIFYPYEWYKFETQLLNDEKALIYQYIYQTTWFNKQAILIGSFAKYKCYNTERKNYKLIAFAAEYEKRYAMIDLLQERYYEKNR